MAPFELIAHLNVGDLRSAGLSLLPTGAAPHQEVVTNADTPAFGDSAISIALRYWHPADIASAWHVRSAEAIAAKRALDEAFTAIPSRSARCPSERAMTLRRPAGPRPVSGVPRS